MTQKVAYTNARLLDPATAMDTRGDVLTVDGEIADVGSLFPDGAPDDCAKVDCTGHCLAPGLIDMMAALGEPGREHKETIATGTRAAAAGGITTVVASPDTRPIMDEIALVEFLERQAQSSGVVKVLPTATITKGMAGDEMTEIGLLAEAGAVLFTDCYRSIANPQVLRRALSYASTFDALIAHHTEVPELVGDGVMNDGETATRLGLGGIPGAAETIMLERDLRIVELTGGRYHAASISTADSVAAMKNAKEKGLRVTCGVAPYHFALNENEVGHYRTFAKVSPPLRSETDREAIVAGLADGTIDIIASHHRPEDPEAKRLPFAQAAYGAVGLETLFLVGLELHHKGQLPLLDLLARLTIGPANILGLPQGRLKRGAPADLVIFNPATPARIDAATFQSKSKNSPFDQRPVQGRVLRTVVAGATVFEAS
ncbi:MAG: dihydroorotase [Alphaproteobacteria bacterium]|jgi:dihydroorotase|nr:dihydroorotase [Alphaproteobacteria bacterium]